MDTLNHTFKDSQTTNPNAAQIAQLFKHQNICFSNAEIRKLKELSSGNH
jgi:hypothetical protein